MKMLVTCARTESCRRYSRAYIHHLFKAEEKKKQKQQEKENEKKGL